MRYSAKRGLASVLALLLGVLFLGTPRTSAVAEAVGELPTTAYSAQLHVHASFSENNGSMESETLEAERIGLDVLWWSDHDGYFTQYRAASCFTFETEGEPMYLNELWQPLKAHHMNQNKFFTFRGAPGMDSYSGAISADEAFEGQHSFRVEGQAGQSEYSQVLYTFDSDTNRHQQALAAGIDIELMILPVEIGIDARPIINVELSLHGVDATHYKIRYYLDNTPGATPFLEGATYQVPLSYTEGVWNSYVLTVTDDAVDAFGYLLGRDNTLFKIDIGVESRNDAYALAYFDDFRFTWDMTYPALYDHQRELLDLLQAQIPAVIQLQGAEISEELHMNDFSVGTELPDYRALAEEGGFLGLDGMVNDEQGFEVYVAERIVADAHSRNGVVSLAHPLGMSRHSSGGEDRVAILDEIVANRAYGVDLLEVGYVARGGHDLADHLWLWDALTAEELYVVGVGVTDSHATTFGSTDDQDNNFVSWIYAASPSKTDLIDGLERGRVYFGDPTRFDGSVELTTGNGHRMGQVVVTDATAATVDVVIDGTVAGDEIRTIRNGELTSTRIADATAVAFSETVSIDGPTLFRVEVWAADGEEKVFSNPVTFTPAVPPEGVDSYRMAIDFSGIHSVAADGFTLERAMHRTLATGEVWKMQGTADGGTLVFDMGSYGQPDGVKFGGGLTGTWSYADGLLTFENLTGAGWFGIRELN